MTKTYYFFYDGAAVTGFGDTSDLTSAVKIEQDGWSTITHAYYMDGKRLREPHLGLHFYRSQPNTFPITRKQFRQFLKDRKPIARP